MVGAEQRKAEEARDVHVDLDARELVAQRPAEIEVRAVRLLRQRAQRPSALAPGLRLRVNHGLAGGLGCLALLLDGRGLLSAPRWCA